MRSPEMQNRGGSSAPASRDLLCVGWSHPLITARGWQAQTLASRFCLSPWMAQDMARLCFGEGRSDD